MGGVRSTTAPMASVYPTYADPAVMLTSRAVTRGDRAVSAPALGGVGRLRVLRRRARVGRLGGRVGGGRLAAVVRHVLEDAAGVVGVEAGLERRHRAAAEPDHVDAWGGDV